MYQIIRPIIPAIILALFQVGALAADTGPLLTPGELAGALERGAVPVILDIRQGTADDGTTDIYAAGHIAGAVHAPYRLFRGPADNPGQLVTRENLQGTLRNLGLEKERPLVIVHQGKNGSDFGSAARVYWTLKSSGFDDLAILNGGVNAWKEAGHTLQKGPPAPIVPSNVEIVFADTWLATTADVERIIDAEEPVALIDARPEEFWAGDRKHPKALRPGTLPQSRFFSQARWFDSDAPTLVDEARLATLLREGRFSGETAIVSFCNTGHWAATNWFVLSELAGLPDVRLYPGSMVEYSQSGGLMANVPGVLRNTWNKLAGKY